jgi:2-desacetyl-2-hydroxyethyl bacteriochlorophyllide A dehydrogenase
MRAMILKGPGDLQPGNVDQPEPGEGEVLVRVSYSGICGTDLEIYRGGIPVDYPRIMGHEMIGEVAENTPTGPPAGTRVIVDPVTYCGTCYHCRAGQSNLCPSGGGLIGRDRDGGFAEFVSVPTQNLFPLPDEINNRDAPLVQVLTTCVHAQSMAPIRPGESVVVIGLGVTGQLHVQLAKAAGAASVIGLTRSMWKRDLAKELGADVALEPGEGAKQRILDMTEGRGADLIIETSGNLSALAQAIDLARIGGRILPFGIYTGTNVELPFYQFYFKELQILNSRAAKGDDYTPSLELVEQGKVRLHPLISHKMPLENLDKALDTLESSSSRSMKIILKH